MPFYEHVFLARQDLAQTQVDAIAANVTKIVEDHKGTVTKTETWGLRQIAYKIAKNRKAHYVMLNIDAPGDVVLEIERQASINEDIIRYLTIKVDAHETGPSVMMRKQDRPERSERGDGFDRPRGDRPDRGGGDRGDRPRRREFADSDAE